MEDISKHISFDEATESPTGLRMGIKNVPNENHIKAMKLVAEKCFEPLREWYNKPIRINSFYRCPELNKAVKGSPTSDHMNGCSIDLSVGSKEENKKLHDWCKDNLDFDQLIWEYQGSWIHISYKQKGNRKMTFSIG
jgi:hypothetical protein